MTPGIVWSTTHGAYLAGKFLHLLNRDLRVGAVRRGSMIGAVLDAIAVPSRPRRASVMNLFEGVYTTVTTRHWYGALVWPPETTSCSSSRAAKAAPGDSQARSE